MSRIIDRVSAVTRQRIERAQAAFSREPTTGRWDQFRRVMVDAEREASDWVPAGPAQHFDSRTLLSPRPRA